MINVKKFHPAFTDLFIRDHKLNISLVCFTQPNFPIPNNATHFFIMKVPPKKQELQQITIDNSSDFNSKYFIELYRKSTAKDIHFQLLT